ncbi:MAG: DUF5663 domain-containing protein [Candidatus Saccharimonadales bacterium]|jgi:hypothetical protein
MAFTLDFTTLDELGLGSLPVEEKKKMLAHILETLEMRVGTTLASRMTDEQLDEFERLMPTEQDNPATIQEKEQAALKWLEGNFPTYKEVVADELSKLMAEIKQVAPQILADTAQANNQAATS